MRLVVDICAATAAEAGRWVLLEVVGVRRGPESVRRGELSRGEMMLTAGLLLLRRRRRVVRIEVR